MSKIIDLNATAGYQAGADLVIEMSQPAVAIAQTTTIFIWGGPRRCTH
jgi:hypothetical protein